MANFVVLIEEVGGELELFISDPAGLTEQKNRRNGASADPRAENKGRKEFIKKQKGKRAQPGNKEPDIVGPHLPIILLRGDRVTFKQLGVGATQFVIDVQYNDGFLAPGDPVPPRSPFRVPVTNVPFTVPQTSHSDGANNQIVEAEFDGSNQFHKDVTDFIFYKCTVWANNLELDPDIICDR